MHISRIFQSGRSQAVQLPKEFCFAGTEVWVQPFGAGVLLLPVGNPWAILSAALDAFEPGFILQREQPKPHVREAIAP